MHVDMVWIDSPLRVASGLMVDVVSTQLVIVCDGSHMGRKVLLIMTLALVIARES